MEQIEGVVEDVVFRNDQNGWTVLSVKAGRETVPCVGVLPPLHAGERLKLTGEWAEHRDYGRQLKVTSFESVRPTTARGIERYLASGAIRGVGASTAKLIVQHFGDDALTVLADEPDRLTEIVGIGPKRAAMIAEGYSAQRESRQLMVFLQTYGIGAALANKVVRAFGDRTMQVVRSDPYQLAERVEGVGFKTADGIASALGVEPESEHRLTCGVKFALDEAVVQGGHTYLPRPMLVERARALLNVGAPLVERAVDQLILLNELVVREEEGGGAIYLKRLYEAEGEVARRLRALGQHAFPSLGDAEARIAAFEEREQIALHQAQRDALLCAVSQGISILTGGPGTGKTTCLHGMLKLLSELGDTVLCAPTGRAAKRMSEATDAPAQTIHRLLEYDGENFARFEQNPIEAGAVIVDEMSMVDIFLMRALLRALPAGCRLVLVGDQDQLPSVGAGNVLSDLISSGVLKVTRLTEIFRQAGESAIVTNAHRINRGEMPIANRRGTDFFFERADGPKEAAELVRALISERLPKYLNVDALRAIQVMSPMKKGDAGVWALNRSLREALNPARGDKHEIMANGGILREGDKVMQVRNSYELEWTREGERGLGAFNGDIGFISEIDPGERTVTVTFDDERVAVYGEEELEDLEPAYCVTVHKSQGSEFEAVVLPLVSGPPMLYTRNLLYTAVTRARKLVVLVGRADCVQKMVENNYVSHRYTALAERLREG
ncbi:MAG: ATP-dependent RecD-like DNA helicase [Christensenellaceae bacterium]|nr:ATP-dependent RecD-like DNA helicase [Christensenellaceae bacterium]MEA5069309.1 ATP-dependent RecD-like DNA helicase [Christensenellaceae bacterium]